MAPLRTTLPYAVAAACLVVGFHDQPGVPRAAERTAPTSSSSLTAGGVSLGAATGADLEPFTGRFEAADLAWSFSAPHQQLQVHRPDGRVTTLERVSEHEFRGDGGVLRIEFELAGESASGCLIEAPGTAIRALRR